MALYGGITLPGKPDLSNVQKLDLLPMEAIAEMQRTGMAIDKEWFSQLSTQLDGEIKELRREICDYIPPEKLDEFTARANMSENEDSDDPDSDSSLPMNVGSTQQLSKLLFDVLGVGKGRTLKMTKSGSQISTGKKELEKFKREHPVVPKVLDYKERVKLKGSFSDKLPLMSVVHKAGTCWCGERHWYPSDRVHSTILTTRTTTGRFASKWPNLQQIPARTELGRKIRGGFIPSKGMEMFAVDFGQFEMRLAAHYSQDENLIRIFHEGLDPHTDTAMRAFKKTKEEVESPIGKLLYRAPCKNVNFGVCIAEGQLVLTDSGLVPIEDITCCHMVWDGIEFVSHDGLICRGIKEVITYEGVTATPDHKVWIKGCPQPRPLSEAMAEGSRLVVSGFNETGLRVSENYIQENSHGCETEKAPGSERDLRNVQKNKRSFCKQYFVRIYKRLHMSTRVKIHRSSFSSSFRKVRDYCTTVYQSFKSKLARLRRERNSEQVQELQGVFGLHAGIPAAQGLPWSGYWTNRERRSLRDWKSGIANKKKELDEYQTKQTLRVQRLTDTSNGNDRENAERLPGFQPEQRQSGKIGVFGSELGRDSEKSPTRTLSNVYDILNAGPRRRFTVSGKLVSNCYGLSGEGLYDLMLLTYATAGLDIPDWLTLDWCNEFIIAWYELYPGMNGYMDNQFYRAQRYGVVWTLLGRVRRVPEVRSVHPRIVAAGLRQSGNAPIQGTQGDLFRLSLAECYKEAIQWARNQDVEARMTMAIHDEMVGEVEEGYGEMVVWRMEELMSQVMLDRDTGQDMCYVPILAEGKTMTRWKK